MSAIKRHQIPVSKCHYRFTKNAPSNHSQRNMNRTDTLSQSSLLQEMIRIKKLRFKDIEERKLRPHVTREYFKRRANFEEFKAVYGDYVSKESSSKVNHVVHKTKSGSLYKVPRVFSKLEHVETVNIELPLHYGGDRAVQIIENKIKPKRASHLPKVHREVTTETQHRQQPFQKKTLKKPKKSVTIVETLNTIDEVASIESETMITDRQLKEIEKHLTMRKERIHKNLPKPLLPKPSRKKNINNGKLMSTLSSINNKLQTMQEKYFTIPRVQYKTVNDCFTQSGNLEVFFENKNFKEVDDGRNERPLPWELQNAKIHDQTNKMKDLFPEFPKIEKTLKQIENHLDDIARQDKEDEAVESNHEEYVKNKKLNHQLTEMWMEGDLEDMLENLDEHVPVEDSLTKEILKTQEKLKNQKLKTISYQIDRVEDFCEKISSIVNNESIGSVESVANSNRYSPRYPNSEYLRRLEQEEKNIASRLEQPNVSKSTYIEGPDLESTIKKSNYLSRELNQYDSQPMVKIFSEDKRSFWRDRMQEIREQKQYSVESVTKMIDALKLTLESSIYEPVA